MNPVESQIKSSMEIMAEVYRGAYEAGLAEGRRQCWEEVKKILDDGLKNK